MEFSVSGEYQNHCSVCSYLVNGAFLPATIHADPNSNLIAFSCGWCALTPFFKPSIGLSIREYVNASTSVIKEKLKRVGPVK